MDAVWGETGVGTRAQERGGEGYVRQGHSEAGRFVSLLSWGNVVVAGRVGSNRGSGGGELGQGWRDRRRGRPTRVGVAVWDACAGGRGGGWVLWRGEESQVVLGWGVRLQRRRA